MNCHLTLTKRTETGKGAARQLRREGKVPAVLYGKGETISLTLDPVEFNNVLRSKQQGYVLITLGEAKTKGAAQHNVILKDLQYDPISGHVLHADFFEVQMDQPIQVTIPIVIAGSIPLGVTLGGVLRQRQRRLSVEGLPADIPDSVVIDASKLDIGQTVKIKDIPIEKGVKIQDDLEKIVVSISAKKQVVEATEGESEEKVQETPAPATPST
ncbi:MAG TPA: 50S ribosomal protein L25 [Nitrospirales bacterium]|nr:50S ribosomal protein L25 [Nitrospirales bacterium]